MFFPEGGVLLPNEPCKVACKVLAEDSVSGFISDENKDSIAPLLFHTTKYALAQFTPQKGMRYYAYYRGNDQQWMYTELPPVEENAYALSVNQTPNKLIVAVHGKSNHPQAPYRLTLRSGEQIYYQAVWNPQSQGLIFDKSKFLSGILRIELTDKQGEIISERPVFLLNNNQIAISNTVNKQKEHLELILKLTFQDQPLTGSYSVYVTESTGNHSSNQLFALYPTDDMQQNLKYIFCFSGKDTTKHTLIRSLYVMQNCPSRYANHPVGRNFHQRDCLPKGRTSKRVRAVCRLYSFTKTD